MTFGATQILSILRIRNNKPTKRPTETPTITTPSEKPEVPETQQNFVRVYPSSAPPRYTNRPAGSSRFRERLSLDMTAPKNSAEQAEQPRHLMESMAMVPETTVEEHRREDRQACVPQVKEVVSSVSNLIRSAVEVVRQRSGTPSPSPSSVGDSSISDEEPFSVLAKFKLAGAEKLNMPRPPPPAAVGSPQYLSYADMVDAGSRPRLRVMNLTLSTAKDTNFRAKLAASASLCYRTDIDIPDDASVSSSSSWPDYPEYHVDRKDDVSDGISEAFRAARRFFLDEWSVEEAGPAKSRFSLCSSEDGELGDCGNERECVVDGGSDDATEAVPAVRRFSLDEGSFEEAGPAGSRSPSSAISNGGTEDLGIERWWATDPRPVDDNSSADADDEGDEENNSSFPYYVRQGPLRVRNASVSTSSEGSVPASAPTDWYYTQDSAGTSEGNLADDDMAFYEGLYEEPSPDNHSGSIDQSQFADFDGDFTEAPSLTNDTSPENSSRNESSSGRVLRVVNQTSPQDGAGTENDDCPSESESDDESPQRGRSRTRRAQ
ncbi:hypothetical protein J4E85_005050 [Alternaria conjuncta]|uniref:uncharacterized protein n=1 Tax=Alternaria conjuncta TaxID=181017 RepID=UPI00221EB620|nr:uncharacterized protein J4E85_005050 [Alternaria conjuncta]KAI4930423.1 hypothetical protein J4E85_005050 [Alternaria conjuncta]